MNQEDIDTLANFEQVWQRVMGETESAEQTAPKLRLNEVIDSLQELWCAYRTMAGRAPQHLRRHLLELARRTRCCIGELQLEYFLETGDIHTPESDVKFASCTMSNLRKIWGKASNLEKKLQTVQEENHDGNWEPLLQVREELQSQAVELKQILSRFFQ